MITSRSDLFASADKGSTIVTATSRLARVLQKEFAFWKQADGAMAWETPDILPINSWLTRCISSASMRIAVSPVLPEGTLDGIHEEVLWEDAIREHTGDAGALSVEALARLMMRAHGMERQWLMSSVIDAGASDDAALYVAIRDKVLRRCASSGIQPSAMQWETCGALLNVGAVRLPSALILAGFERTLPTALRKLLDILASRGSMVMRFESASVRREARRMTFSNRDEEVLAAAAWARGLLESGEEDIGIVFPRLQDDRARVERVFAEVLLPEIVVGSSSDSDAVFELSLGVRLAREPLVNAALHALDLLRPVVSSATVSRILRSPFVSGSTVYAASRGCVDAELRRSALDEEAWTSFRSRLAHCRAADENDILLGRIAAIQLPVERSVPSVWADYFDVFLSELGWPGERMLDSREYQARMRFQEQLGAMAGFDTLLGSITAQEAVARLRRLANAAVFHPQSKNAPVQIMGVFEALGQQFRHLRVCDMTEESWPPPARPAAFIPVALQKRAGVADAVADIHAADMERVTISLLSSSPDLVISSAATADDRELLPSPLSVSYPLVETDSAATPTASWLREVSSIVLENLTDSTAPALPPHCDAPGGSSLFTLQAGCPFRAFAQLRLSLRALALPEHGVRPLDRGNLLHDCLRKLWEALRDQAVLLAGDPSPLIDDIVAEVFRSAASIRSGRLAEAMIRAERQCVTRVLREFLDLERSREPFEVLHVEKPGTVTMAGMTLSLKIDRVDRLSNGALAVIDYKTSAKSISDWMSQRPLEPQLPLYVLTMRDSVSALAFAAVKRAECRYIGIADSVEHFSLLTDVEELTDEQERPQSWDALVSGWAVTLEALAESFRSGDARVDPRDGAVTCAYCDIRPLCRIDEYRLQKSGNTEDGDD